MDVEGDSVFGDLEDQATCYICFEIFKEPITLHCGHSFCLDCANKIYQKSPSCAYCRKPFGLPLPGVNPDIIRLVDQFLKSKDLGDKKMKDAPFQQSSYLLYLPKEIFIEVLAYLPPKMIGKTCRVSKDVQRIADDSWLWRGICQKSFPFCSVDKYGKNWKWCFIARSNIHIGWEEGKASQFEMIPLRGHKNYVNCFRLYRNNVVSGSGDNNLKVWKTESEDSLATLVGHDNLIKCLQFNEVKIVSGSADNTAKIWDTKTGIAIKTLSHQSEVNTLQFDDSKIITGSADGVKIWDIRDGSSIMNLGGQPTAVNSLEFDNNRIVSMAYNNIRVYDIRNGNVIRDISDVNLTHFQLIGSQNKLVSGSAQGEIKVWDLNNGLGTVLSAADYQPVNNLKTNGKHVAYSSGVNVKYFELAGMKLLNTFNEHKGDVNSLQFSENKLVTASADNTIRVFDLKKGKKLYALLGGSLQKRANNPDHPRLQGCTGVEFDDSRIVGSFSSLLRVYDFEVFKPPQ